MKRILLMAFLLVATLTATAQHFLKGVVVEAGTQEPMVQTTVRLMKKDSVVAAGAVTDVMGRFRVQIPKTGRYTIQITSMGFKSLSFMLRLGNDKDMDLGTIIMEPEAIMLQGAVVTGQASKVVVKADTFVYNASAYRTPEGAVLEELVKRLPGAQIDDDGKITINGKEVKKIMVDGKEFMTGDTKTALKNLPTDIVERVKAYDQKSDQARISGVDDGEEETVLDFGIKRGMNKGLMVNSDLAAGTHHRYSGRIFGGWMKDNLKLFLMTNANNVNDMGFSRGGGRWGGGRQGLNAPKMAGLNLNYEKKNLLKWDGSIRWNHSDGDALVRQSTENFVSSMASTFGNSIRQNYSCTNSWDGRMRIEWMPDTLWNILFRPEWRYNTNDGLNVGRSATFSADPYSISGIIDPLEPSQLDALAAAGVVKNSNLNNSINYTDSKSLGGTLQVNRRLSASGRNIMLRVGANYGEGISHSFSNDSVNYYQLVTGNTYQANRYSVTPTKNWNYHVRGTYSEPLWPRTYLQFMYEYQYKYTKSDRGTYDLSGHGWDFFSVVPEYRGWDDELALLNGARLEDYRNPKLSRFSEYRNYIHTAELSLKMTRRAYNLTVGVKVMPQRSHFTQDFQGVHTDTVRTVTNVAPTAEFRYKFSDVSQLRLTYRANTDQPSITDLLDITDDSNPLDIHTGNPGLKPSFTHRFRLFYNNYFQKHQRSVMAHLFFNTTTNSVSNMATYDPVTGGRITRPENIDGNWNAFAMLMFNTAVDSAAYFYVNTFTTFRYVNSVAYVSLNKQNSEKSTTRSATLGERLAASYRNDWIEIELNGQVDYMRARSELQTNNNMDTWNFSYGGNIQLTAPWNMQLSTSLSMNSRRGYNDAAMNTNELIWNAQLSQSFLRGKALTLSLQFYDLLNQQSTFSRNVTAVQRTDTEYNAITQYAMLHVIYKLNLFGGAKNMQGPHGDRLGGWGRGRPGGGHPGGGRPGGGWGGRRF